MFAGQVAVVTGGASGIGAATAELLAGGGARVAVADLDAKRAQAVADEIGGLAVEVDVADAEWVRSAMAQVQQTLGDVDVLVNGAGWDRFAFFVDTKPDDWDQVLAINLRGTMACTHAVLPMMHSRRRGVIVNVASEAGVGGTVAGAAYAAAKAGVIGFTKAIAKESAHYGVRCNAVAPGPIETPLLNGAVQRSGQLGARLKQAMIDATVLGRSGAAAEVAASIAYLASADASYVTGQTLAVNGGISMH